MYLTHRFIKRMFSSTNFSQYFLLSYYYLTDLTEHTCSGYERGLWVMRVCSCSVSICGVEQCYTSTPVQRCCSLGLTIL